jgi:hypothetical protein
MNIREAKEILSLFRPGTADVEDPTFAVARQLCASEPELQRWFDEHCAVYTALRAKLKQIPVPAGLKEQILAGQKIHRPMFWRRPAVLAAAAMIALLIAFTSFWLPSGEATGFSNYREQMVSTALRGYGMDLETDNLAQINAYLAQHHSPSDTVLPAGLQTARLMGCVAALWQDQPASLICFRSGKPLRPGQTTDLWLFVIEQKNLRGAPSTTVPSLAKVNTAMTASWSEGGRTYVLVTDGDEAALRKYL